jgi:hypothetical protein
MFSRRDSRSIGSYSTSSNKAVDSAWNNHLFRLLEIIPQHSVSLLLHIACFANITFKHFPLHLRLLTRNYNDYSHMTVNHDQFYKDPITGAHTNTVEGSYHC